jgi:hypothetical protein
MAMTRYVEIQLTHTARARFEPDGGLAEEPRWDILGNQVRLGPLHSAQEAEDLRNASVGSLEGLLPLERVDELFFNPSHLGLRALQLWVPEENLASGELLETWRDLPIQTGTLHLVGSAEFTLRPTRSRWLDADGMGLVCVTHAAFNPGNDFARLRIAPDLDLLCKDNEYVGWCLASGERAIVSGWESRIETPADPELNEITRQYLDVVTARAVERMQEGGLDIQRRLLNLQQQVEVQAAGDRRRQILYEGLTCLLDRYYRPA